MIPPVDSTIGGTLLRVAVLASALARVLSPPARSLTEARRG